MPEPRLSYEASCRRLEGWLDPGSIPPIPDRLPQADEPEPLGVSFFRTRVGDGDDLGNLTLPRTFFGRSEINDVSFRNTDLTESNLCWSDFIDVDFTDATLARSDMRASLFQRVTFDRADLRGADLRRSSYEHCTFDGARMEGAVLTRGQGRGLPVSAEQRTAVAWTNEDGPAPDGG